jgi:hypothetical protein
MRIADVDVATLLERPRHELIALWRRLHRSEPPKGMGSTLLARAVAYAVQAKRHGGLSAKTRRQLEHIVRSRAGAQPQPQKTLRSGARLVRTWKGVDHVVDVVDGGFLWAGKHYRSLSSIAQAITGARWSGPRFFGLGS